MAQYEIPKEYATYVTNKKVVTETTFRIKPNGQSVFVVGEKEVPEQDFLNMHPIGLIPNKLSKGRNYDTTKDWQY